MATYKKKNAYEEMKTPSVPLPTSTAPPNKAFDEAQDMKIKIEEYKKKSPRIEGRELVYPNGERVSGSFASLIDLKQDWLRNNPDVVNPEKERLKKIRIEQQIKDDKLKEDLTKEQNVTSEQLLNLGNAPVSANPNELERAELGQILGEVGQQASIGATAGLGTGAAIGLLGGPAAPVSVPVAAGAGAIVGAVGGGVRAVWGEFRDVSKDNIKGVSGNFGTAKTVVNQAITNANLGEDYNTINQKYSEALANIDLAERQAKEQSKKFFGKKNDAKDLLKEIELYKRYELPNLKYRLEVALQKPDPSFLQNKGGVQ